MTLVYSGDIGARLTISTNNTTMDVSTVITALIKRPDSTSVTVSPTVNFTTGVLTYDTVSGDLSVAGEYKVQLHAVFDDGDDLRSEVDSFYAYSKLT